MKRTARFAALMGTVAMVAAGLGATAAIGAAPAVAATSAYANAVLGDGAVAYYRLDEGSGTLAADATGNGSNGTYQPAATQGAAGALTSETDAAVSGNGTGPVVTAPDTNLPFTPTAFDQLPASTIELWFNIPTTASSIEGLLTYGDMASARTDGISVSLLTNNVVVYEGGASLIPLPSELNDGHWHMLDITAVAGTSFVYTAYLDGQSVGTGYEASPLYSGGPAGLLLGASTMSGNVPYDYLNGSLDEVAIYPTALSAAQVESHYSIGTAVAPEAPTGVTASLSGGSVNLSWTTPAAGSSPITSYTVVPSPACGSCTGLQVTASGTNPAPTSTTIGGLAPNTTYTFTVTATSAVKTGPASEPSSSVTVPMSHQLTVGLNPASLGSGIITGTTAGSSISCGAGANVCSEPVYYQGAQPGTETLSAVPDAGSYFSGWTGCAADDSPADQLCTVTVDHDMSVEAAFQTCPVSDCSPVPLTVGADPASTGEGQISGPDGGLTGAIACSPAPTDVASPPAGCQAQYPYGAAVTLKANGIGTTDAATVLGWNVPGCRPATLTCTVVVTRDASGNTVVSSGGTNAPITGPVLVKFGLGSYTLHVRDSGGGTMTLSPPSSDTSCTGSCDDAYSTGTTVTLSAHPDPGYSFSDWGTSCPSGTGNPGSMIAADGTNECLVTMTGGTNEFTVDANFKVNSYGVTVLHTGAGSGVVDSGAAGSPAPIDCDTDTVTGPAVCAAFFPYGTTVTLTATPQSGSTVADWSHCETRTADSCTFTVTGATAEQVDFGVVPPTVTSVSPDYGIDPTKAVTITGTGFTPADQVAFGANPATSFTVESDTSILAFPPAAAGQVVDVTVHNPGGTSPTSAADHYSYTDLPPDIPPSTTVSAPNLDSSTFVYDTTVGGQTVHITVPEGALPAGTTFYVYALGSDPSSQQKLESLLPANAKLDGAFGLSWLTPAGTTPNPPTAKPIVFTVSAPGLTPGSSLSESTSGGILGLDPMHLYVFTPGNAVYDPNADTFTGLIAGSSKVIAAGGGNIFEVPGGNVIAAGGGNVIAAGGGNVIAAGGGNVIAAGAGNMVMSLSAGLVAIGSGTFYSASNGFVPQPFTGANGVIAAGGGNVIAAGGGNFLSDASSLANMEAGYNSLISQSSGVIAAGGGNFISGANGGAMIATNASELVATNAGSLTSASFGDPLFLAAVTPPAAPATVTGAGSTGSLSAQWTPALDGGSPVTSYTVTAHPKGAAGTAGDHSVVVTPAGGAASFDPSSFTLLTATVAGLTPGTYDVTVAATNAQGSGPASTAIDVTVPVPGSVAPPPTLTPAPTPGIPAPHFPTAPAGPPATAPVATPGPAGYRLIGGDGGVFDFGGAGFFGSLAGQALTGPVVASAATPDGNGYWVVTRSGAVAPFGDAQTFGDLTGVALAGPITGMAATPDGHGYWLVGSDGGVFAFGDAGLLGDLAGTHLAAPIVGLAATPDGHGYWLAGSDGGVFSFGDAGFAGSAGGLPLAAPVVGLSATPDGHGYWLVASDGGVFSFGDAPFEGSAAGTHLASPVVGIG